MMVMKLLIEGDMYGYQIIQQLADRSENVFQLKAGTLYPLLHTLEQKGYITSYENMADNSKLRRYYHITEDGRKSLLNKESEWKSYVHAVNLMLGDDHG